MTGSTDLDLAGMWEEGLRPDSPESREARLELARDARHRRRPPASDRARIPSGVLTFVLTGLLVTFAFGGITLASGRGWSGWALLLIPGIPMVLVVIVLAVDSARRLASRRAAGARALSLRPGGKR